MDRRGFLQNVAATAVGGACLRGGEAQAAVAAGKPRRATLAQVTLHKNVEQNLASARRALEQAGEERPISSSSLSCFARAVSAISGKTR